MYHYVLAYKILWFPLSYCVAKLQHPKMKVIIVSLVHAVFIFGYLFFCQF